MDKRKDFGEHIKRLRLERGLSCQKASELLGYRTFGTLHNVERGLTPLPIERIFDVAALYDTPIEDILEKLEACEPEVYRKYKELEKRFNQRFLDQATAYVSTRTREIARHHRPFPSLWGENQGEGYDNIYYRTMPVLTLVVLILSF